MYSMPIWKSKNTHLNIYYHGVYQSFQVILRAQPQCSEIPSEVYRRALAKNTKSSQNTPLFCVRARASSVAGVWLQWKRCCCVREISRWSTRGDNERDRVRALEKVFCVAEGRPEITRLLTLRFCGAHLIGVWATLACFYHIRWRHDINLRVFFFSFTFTGALIFFSQISHRLSLCVVFV